MRFVFLLCVLLSAGCDAFRDEVPGLFAAAVQEPRSVPTRSPLRSTSHPSAAPTVAPGSFDHLPRLARQLEVKFKPPAMPTLTKEQDCAVAPSLRFDSSEAKRLVLVNVDARLQTRNLIARRVSERLESGEAALLQSVFDSNRPGDTMSVGRRDVPTAAVTLTADDLGRIQKQHHLGVFYVTEYQGPALILRLGKIRREWFEGHLRARFVLYDTEPQRVICGAELFVKNDAKSAPIRSRLQFETRGRLEHQLGDALRLAAERALGGLGQQFEWPDTGMLKAQ